MNTVIQDRGKTIYVAEGGGFHMLRIAFISAFIWEGIRYISESESALGLIEISYS